MLGREQDSRGVREGWMMRKVRQQTQDNSFESFGLSKIMQLTLSSIISLNAEENSLLIF